LSSETSILSQSYKLNIAAKLWKKNRKTLCCNPLRSSAALLVKKLKRQQSSSSSSLLRSSR
jgi:hypothetical protein